ncbi:MAG: twin-arginine translocation signal domain-containing protein, partial [Chloroflexota bacterium]|nr:twin-arginine translocation signal domain-containing protein [Chloroflexota bacterium]
MSTWDRGPSRHMVSRREFLRISGLGGGALLLAGCGTVQQQATVAPDDGTETARGPAVSEKVALEFWLPGGSAPFCKVQNDIAQGYTGQRPSIDMREVKCGVGEQNFTEVLLARVAAGNPPDATLY